MLSILEFNSLNAKSQNKYITYAPFSWDVFYKKWGSKLRKGKIRDPGSRESSTGDKPKTSSGRWWRETLRG